MYVVSYNSSRKNGKYRTVHRDVVPNVNVEGNVGNQRGDQINKNTANNKRRIVV